MRRTMLLAALMLTACNVQTHAPDEKASAPVALEKRLLCLPVASEAEIFRDAKAQNLGEDTWRQFQSSACVRAQARILARGTDAAPVIAEAALEECRPQANLWSRASLRGYTRQPVTEKDRRENLANILNLLRRAAIMEVLKARAGGCYEELVQDSRYSHDVDTKP